MAAIQVAKRDDGLVWLFLSRFFLKSIPKFFGSLTLISGDSVSRTLSEDRQNTTIYLDFGALFERHWTLPSITALYSTVILLQRIAALVWLILLS